MFDRIAPRYDRLNRIISLGQDRRWRRRTVAALRLTPGATVLDLGCGTGDLCDVVAAAGYSPIGVDFSAGMLAAAHTGAPLARADALGAAGSRRVHRRRRQRVRAPQLRRSRPLLPGVRARVCGPAGVSPPSRPPSPAAPCSGPGTTSGSGASCRSSGRPCRTTPRPTSTCPARPPTCRHPTTCLHWSRGPVSQASSGARSPPVRCNSSRERDHDGDLRRRRSRRPHPGGRSARRSARLVLARRLRVAERRVRLRHIRCRGAGSCRRPRSRPRRYRGRRPRCAGGNRCDRGECVAVPRRDRGRAGDSRCPSSESMRTGVRGAPRSDRRRPLRRTRRRRPPGSASRVGCPGPSGHRRCTPSSTRSPPEIWRRRCSPAKSSCTPTHRSTRVSSSTVCAPPKAGAWCSPPTVSWARRRSCSYAGRARASVAAHGRHDPAGCDRRRRQRRRGRARRLRQRRPRAPTGRRCRRGRLARRRRRRHHGARP